MNSSLGFSELNNNEDIKNVEEKTNSKNHNKIKNKIKNKKVQQILESVNEDSDDESGLSNVFPEPPKLIQKKKIDRNLNSNFRNPQQNNENKGYYQDEENDNDVNQEGFNQLESSYMREYYNNYLPYYTQSNNNQSLSGEKDVLIEKLNYMIELLEEQKEEKTGHISEELILYSFLGVFIIFVVDSFARAGKYVR